MRANGEKVENLNPELQEAKFLHRDSRPRLLRRAKLASFPVLLTWPQVNPAIAPFTMA